MRTCQLMRLTCELPFHCLARSCHLEVLMVISIDSLLIKQLRKLLNVILVISLFTWQDVWRDNSILENLSILTDITTLFLWTRWWDKPPPIAVPAVAWTQAQVVNSNSTSSGKETLNQTNTFLNHIIILFSISLYWYFLPSELAHR